MLRLCILLIILLVPPAHSDDGLGGPQFDNLTESTYRQISWKDFRGKPIKPKGHSRWDGATFAHIATSIRLGSFGVVEQQEGDRWKAVPKDLRPFAVMNKDFSGVQYGTKNDYSLAHEQLHFDISETVARRLAVSLSQLEGEGSSRTAAREDLAAKIRAGFEEGIQDLRALQTRYDGETKHGEKKKKQKKWATKVAGMLQDATEALRQERASVVESP